MFVEMVENEEKGYPRISPPVLLAASNLRIIPSFLSKTPTLGNNKVYHFEDGLLVLVPKVSENRQNPPDSLRGKLLKMTLSALSTPRTASK